MSWLLWAKADAAESNRASSRQSRDEHGTASVWQTAPPMRPVVVRERRRHFCLKTSRATATAETAFGQPE